MQQQQPCSSSSTACSGGEVAVPLRPPSTATVRCGRRTERSPRAKPAGSLFGPERGVGVSTRAGRFEVFFYQLPLSRARPLVLVCPSPLHAPSPPAAVPFPMRRYGAPITAVARETEGTGFSHAVRWLYSVTQATAMVLPL